MNLVFVHDHVFHVFNGLVYSSQLTQNVLNRYLSVFSNIIIVARSITVYSEPCMPLASSKNVEFVFVPSISNIKSYIDGRRRSIKKNLLRIIENSDAVICRLPSELGFLASKIAFNKEVPLGVEVVGCARDALWNYGGLKSKLYAPFSWIKMKRAVLLADSALYVTQSFLQKRYPAKINANVFKASDVELVAPDSGTLKNRLRRICDIFENNKRDLVFGTIGSLNTKYKGIDVAIRALEYVGLEEIRFKYRVLGGGDASYYAELVKNLGLENNIFFDGVLQKRDDVFKWLDNVDIYLQPSLTEGLPRALLEAMSRGCVAIASDVGEMPSLLDNDCIVPSGDFGKLSDLILKIISDKNFLLRSARKNFSTALQFDVSRLDSVRKSFYDSLCHRSSNLSEYKV